MSRPSATAPRSRLAGTATALMAALAGGAVWCLAAIHFQRPLVGFAFVVALVSVMILRANGQAGRASGVIAAIACVALAVVYAFSLQAVALVASLFDLPMGQTMRQMGAAMALDIALANLHGWNLGQAALAALAAAAGMLLPRR